MVEKKEHELTKDDPSENDIKNNLDVNHVNEKKFLELERNDKVGSCHTKDLIIQGKQADFEEAIELTGYGKFHYFLLIVCGFVSTSEEMDVISMSFLLPSAQCDLHLSTYSKGWLNSIIFIGMMVGAYVWGSIADTIGRRKVLIVISFMNALCIVVSSFSQTYWVFMLFRFLNGAALGGSGPVVWSYFAEFQPKKKRGSMLSFMAAFWTLGNLFVASLAWSVIPSEIQLSLPGFIFNSWRVFLMICSVPSFLVAGLLYFLPESPKFLITTGRLDEALAVFSQIYASNTGKPVDSYPILSLASFELEEKTKQKPKEEVVKIEADEKAKNGEKEEKKSIWKMIMDIFQHTKKLFVPPLLRFTIISITINLTFHIGYYGLMMWFPELFNRFDEFARSHGGKEEASVCEVTDFVVHSGSQADINLCDDSMESGVFLESFITVAAAVPSNILAVLFMDSLGRKFFLVFSTVTSGFCAICMFFVHNKTQNLIVSAIFSGVISCGNAALDCLITEIFPTDLRATGVAISMVAARLGGIVGNIVIATLIDMYCPAPTFIVAALLIGGGLLCLILPNTTRVPLK